MNTTLNYKIGQKIGRYEIIQLLGQGAMALVYKAFDPYIDRTLAIKVLREERCIDREYRVRFLREAKAAGNLSHSNIVTIYDIGEFDNRPYIVMELLEGTPLDRLMSSGRKFTIDETVAIGIQLATALDYAHRNGVVHRDIKPSNIICSIPPDNKIKVKITDFGIAHVTDSDLTQQTETGAVLGTPYYISPEQVLGQKADGRSDLFCIGVTMYHLFSGRRPFDGATFHTLLYQIATEDARSITHYIPDFPVQLKDVIDKLLNKKPEKRYQTGLELVEALKNATTDITAKGPKTYKERIFPYALKSTFIMAITLVIVVLTTIAVVQPLQRNNYISHLQEIGTSYCEFIATQNAEPVLREDWIAVDLFVQQASKQPQFQRLAIIDFQGIIQGDTQRNNIGRKFTPPPDSALISDDNNVKVYRHAAQKNTQFFGITLPASAHEFLHPGETFEFSTPITFHNKNFGNVFLVLSPQILDKLVNQSRFYMALLGLICAIAACMIIFVLSSQFSNLNKLLAKYLNQITVGNYSIRINKNRKDEIGKVFKAYNHMADKLQQREIQRKSADH